MRRMLDRVRVWLHRDAEVLAQFAVQIAAQLDELDRHMRATIATVDRMLARVEEYCDDVD
jgi:hypothetical protein